MLDQQDGERQPVADRQDQRAQLLDLVVVEPARRLVEQQQLRLAGKRARELDALLVPNGKSVDRRVGDRVEIEQLDQFVDARAERALPRAAPAGRRSASAIKPVRVRQWPPTMMFSRTVMVRNSARFWKVRPMPSAAMRCTGTSSAAVRRRTGSRRRSRRVEPAQAVEQRGLAGAVRADQAADLAARDVEATRGRARRCRRSAP